MRERETESETEFVQLPGGVHNVVEQQRNRTLSTNSSATTAWDYSTSQLQLSRLQV